MLQTFFGKGLRKVGRGFQRAGNLVDPPAPPPKPTPAETLRAERLAKWYAVDGDITLRVRPCELGPDAVVFDLGGYDGGYAMEMYARFGCRIHVFEPCPPFLGIIRDRFAKNPRFAIHPFGLSAKSETVRMSLNGAGSSAYREGGETFDLPLVRAADFFEREQIGTVDLMKVNIEGGEYDLLDHLIETGLIARVKDLQVQFHEDVLPDADRRMRAIQAALAKTHHLTWQHEWIWENWRRNG